MSAYSLEASLSMSAPGEYGKLAEAIARAWNAAGPAPFARAGALKP